MSGINGWRMTNPSVPRASPAMCTPRIPNLVSIELATVNHVFQTQKWRCSLGVEVAKTSIQHRSGLCLKRLMTLSYTCGSSTSGQPSPRWRQSEGEPGRGQTAYHEGEIELLAKDCTILSFQHSLIMWSHGAWMVTYGVGYQSRRYGEAGAKHRDSIALHHY
jgi:hypothetical protein